MTYRPYSPPGPLLIGYDPFLDLPKDHLARLIENVVESALGIPAPKRQRGYPAFDPRLCIKVLVYGYSLGVRSSRQLERLCHENLGFLFLTRGDTPTYRTLCTVRVENRDLLEQVWVALLAIAQEAGVARLGKIVIDSTKLRADVSTESVLRVSEFEVFRQELARILAEADQADAREEAEGSAAQMQVDAPVSEDQMRDILRRVRQEQHQIHKEQHQAKKTANAKDQDKDDQDKDDGVSGNSAANLDPEPLKAEATDLEVQRPKKISAKMRQRIEQSLKAIQAAALDARKHLCLTDPDARMMPSGTTKRIQECHSLEIATDNGLIVATSTTTQADNARLEAMTQMAAAHEPQGVHQVVADSGYYAGDAVARLAQSGVDVCIPDSYTAYDLHHHQEIGFKRAQSARTIPMAYVPEEDVYVCPEGNRLVFTQERSSSSATEREYRAQRPCLKCPLASACLKQSTAKYRNLKVSVYEDIHRQLREQFSQEDRQALYRHRAEQIETVFGFIRSCLGFQRWSLRGSDRVQCEGMLMACGYQFRKVATALAS